MKKHLAIILMAAMSATAAAAESANLGYSDGTVSRDNIFRLGSSEEQGLAIRLDADKLRTLKGCTITAIQAAFGSSRTTDGNVNLFIARTPDGEKLMQQSSPIKRASAWLTFDLENPYTITGEEGELYIGYTASIATTAKLLSSDFAADIQESSFAYNDGKWTDIAGLGVGNANIRITLDDAPMFADLMLKPIATEGYFKAEQPYTFDGQIFNFGTEPIKNFILKVTVGDDKPWTSYFGDLNIETGSAYDFSFDVREATATGSQPFKVEILSVNNTDDADPADNIYDNDIFYYPAAMERNILLEGFTGTTCTNCPAGHAIMEEFMEGLGPDDIPLIEVMHHSGYQPDMYSMDDDYSYTLFYGSSSTYAPAVMLNRTHFPIIGNVPAMNVSPANIERAYKTLLDEQPYVSLSLKSEYDPATREVKIDFTSLAHNDLPSDINVFNILICQDGIHGYQTGVGADYEHNAVARGSILGNAWGMMLYQGCKEGEVAKWSGTWTLPEAIFSDFWDAQYPDEKDHAPFMIPTDADNMFLVAYVAAFEDSNPNHQQIYNCVKVKLGESHEQGGIPSGISIAEADGMEPIISVADGVITAPGADAVQVYDLSGKAYNPANRLPAGLYIVRAIAGNKVTARKILVK